MKKHTDPWARKNSRSAILAPSLLSANFARLGQEIREVESAGIDWIHVDVMDGAFVPNLTIGPAVVQAIRPLTRGILDCHLMVKHPEIWLEPFAKAGADVITIHAEAATHLDRNLHRIRELGCKAGVSINPATPVSFLEEALDIADLVLLMSVNPGFGGQEFIPSVLSKIERVAEARRDSGKWSFLIEVDGGVNPENAAEIRKAGCDVFVAGSAIFSKKDRKRAVRELRARIDSVKSN